MSAELVALRDFLPPFAIGDTVLLKSGGPVLTVTSHMNNYVEVQWFDGFVAKQKIYPAAALKRHGKRKK